MSPHNYNWREWRPQIIALPLKRASIVASDIIPVGKETDRHWEQGEDMSLLDFKVLEYRPNGNMFVADGGN